MQITVTNTDGNAVMTLTGRLDTVVTSQVTHDIDTRLAQCGPITSLTCDVSGLNYISSSGLRILMGLAKRYNDFRITECPPAVYQVFEVTGFTQIMTIEKALRQLSVEGCEVIGAGGVGVVYRIDDDTIIKVFRQDTTLDEVQNEITMAKESFVLGMPTAISYDIVRVGEQLGLVYELLQADTLSACAKREPARLDEFARQYAGLFRQLHDIHVPLTSRIPSATENVLHAIHYISRYFDAAGIDLLLRIAESIPRDDRLLHCDLQTKNAMVQGDQLMLIDMGEVGYGHPLIDLGNSYSAMVQLLGSYDDIIGMPRDLGGQLWHRMIRYYYQDLSQAEFDHRMEQIKTAALVRNFSWLALSDTFPEEVIRECQRAFDERVMRHKDRILDICKTFNDYI